MPITMKNNRIQQAFWEEKYRKNELGWDMGHVSPPLKAYFDQLVQKDIRILIPGGGNSYEAEYLFRSGFNRVFVLDLVEIPLVNFKKRVPDFPEHQLIQADFFEHRGQYDLVVEQTFFCALDPSLRDKYVDHVHQNLTARGRLAGLLFNSVLQDEGPPFGGSLEEYRRRFKPKFQIINMEPCYNSVKPREGRELFIIFEKIKPPYNE